MIPSNKWFPASLQERAAWFQNFNDKFAVLAAGLGFVPGDVAAVDSDNDAVQWLAAKVVDIDTFSKGMTAYRREVFEGINGDPLPTLPVVPDLSTPATAFPGLFERLDDLVKRIRVAPSYSKEEGEQLGIVPSTTEKTGLDQLKPSLKAQSMPGNVVEVSFVRGQSDGVALELKLDNSIDWTDGGKFFKSPAEVNIPVLNGNLPRAVQVRARFLDGNTPAGQYSDTINVVTTP